MGVNSSCSLTWPEQSVVFVGQVNVFFLHVFDTQNHSRILNVRLILAGV